jgi:UDP-glucose 4-epimerase
MTRILLTGATGYIASHTWLALQEAGFEVVGVDNFSNSSPKVLDRLAELGGRAPVFVQADVGDPQALAAVFAAHPIDAVVHFAAFKAVGESTRIPLAYYRNNIGGLVNVAQAMQDHGTRRLVFSSSATVYGDPASVPITEDFPLSATNPYGRSKLMIEDILRDLIKAEPDWHIALLRYFNPVGAHESGLIGESPSGIPNNLVPYIAQVATGQREKLSVYGGDYPTPDGTGMRDYIHVVDLSIGHVKTLDKLAQGPGLVTYNLGTGHGNSVLEMVRAFEAASGRPVPYQIVDRRPGDIAKCYADPARARDELGWVATRDVAQMCADTWRYQTMSGKA